MAQAGRKGETFAVARDRPEGRQDADPEGGGRKVQQQQEFEPERRGIRDMPDPGKRKERQDPAGGGDREAETGNPEPNQDEGQASDPKDERRPDRSLPDEAQHLGVGHAGGLARHDGALQGEAGPGSQQREDGKRCRLTDHRAVQPAGLAAEDDADEHEPGASEHPEIKQKPRAGRGQFPGVGHRSLHPEGEGVAHGVSVAREAAPFDPVEAAPRVRQRHHEAGREGLLVSLVQI